MTHPLTEELMNKIHGDEPGYSNPYDEDDMRAAYDLAIEHAGEKVYALLSLFHKFERLTKEEAEDAFVGFMQAMRPQEDN